MVGLIGVYVHLCLVVQRQNLRQEDGSRRASTPKKGAPPPSSPPSSASPSPSSLTPAELHHYALTLLDSVTQHSTLSHSTPQTPYLPSSYLSQTPHASSSLLDSLEQSLGADSIPAKTLKQTRAWFERLYGGSQKSRERKERGGIDWSVRGVVLGMKHVAEKFTKEGAKGIITGDYYEGARRDPEMWKERLKQTVSGVALNEEETRCAMEEVVRLMEEAGEKGSGEAWTLLGDLNLLGHLTVPVNTTASAEFYTHASERSGNPEAQYKLGYLYGTNYGDAFGGINSTGSKSQQGSALLHYTFSALSGHVPASMTVGYRHWAGIGTKQSCRDALPWYKSAAEAAIRTFNAGPPGGLHLPPPKLRLSDLAGGVYGPGSGSSKPPTLSTGGSTAQSMQEWQDLIEFHQFHAEKGDSIYMFRLGRLYYGGFGAGGLGGTRGRKPRLSVSTVGDKNDGLWDGGRDFGRSSRWFIRLARKVWSGDGKEAMWDVNKFGPYQSTTTTGQRDPRSSSTPSKKNSPASSTTTGGGSDGKLGYYDPKLDKKNEKVDEQTQMVAGLAAGYLGRMYLRGEGVNVNLQKAFLWFRRGTTRGDRESHNGLGIMYRDGLGVERNLKTAIMHFHAAAQQDLADAQVNLGKYHFGLGETVLATTFFEAAIRTDGIRQPDTFQSYYYLAELASAAPSPTDNCPVTVSFYKHVAERGDWDHEVWFEAERAREKGDLRKALLGYWIMAERGYEVAQNNVAWILDRDKSRIRVPLLDATPIGSSETDRIALKYWTRSAAQDNVDALVKLGDYYFKGIGTSTTSSNDLEGGENVTGPSEGVPQYEKAATFYQSAGTSRLSAMAMWNLGWMHETGQGVPQDFHLAKRYLDSALDTSPNAYFPTTLSLISLYARALYHVLFSPSDEMNALSLFGRDPDPLAEEQEAKGFVPQGGWGFGRAWRDIQRSWGVDVGPEPEVIPLRPGTAGGGGQENQQGQRGQVEDRDAGDGIEGQEPWEYAQQEAKRQRRVGEEEDDEFYIADEGDFGGTVAIIALCMLLAWLVYFRQRPQQRNQPHQAQAQPLAPGQAPTPPHGDQPRPTLTTATDGRRDDGAREEEEEEPRRLV
ncbi:ubiquitin ligase complex subunit HRD3 [Sporobolomyces salmoneus]|uniref:ubiquitin ligase complex subunit HRD3 n=1 Tax=Sporobolomyces salmoneus TaxID=183962 RepID=UPI00316C41BD